MKRHSLYIFLGLLLLGTTAYGASSVIFQREIEPETDNTYYLGTTSPSNLRWKGINAVSAVFTNLTVASCSGCGGANPNSKFATSTADSTDIHPNGAIQVLIGDTTASANASSTLHVVGSISSTASSTSASVTLGALDFHINVNASGGAKTISLPSLASSIGREYVISKTDSSSNAVTVDPSGAETLNGQTTMDIGAQYSSMHIINVTTEWRII